MNVECETGEKCVQGMTKFDRSGKIVKRGWVGKKNRSLRAVSVVSVEISVAKGCSKPIRKLTHRRVRVKASRARWAEHLYGVPQSNARDVTVVSQ